MTLQWHRGSQLSSELDRGEEDGGNRRMIE